MGKIMTFHFGLTARIGHGFTLAAVSMAVSAIVVPTSATAATVIENFDSGSLSPQWVRVGNGNINIGAQAAHDGARGSVNAQNWYYRTDLAPTGEYSAWVRALGGRAYLGFGSDATGTSSFVLAPNSNQLLFQDNAGYNFSPLASSSFSFVNGGWYLAKLSFGASTVGSVYAADGTTLLASLTAPTTVRANNGGLAFRNFGSNMDTLSVASAAVGAVPEPGTWAMMILGFGMVGGAMRRRKAAGAARVAVRFA
jgi:hypothetical protein